MLDGYNAHICIHAVSNQIMTDIINVLLPNHFNVCFCENLIFLRTHSVINKNDQRWK